jgi:hypothetical protein
MRGGVAYRRNSILTVRFGTIAVRVWRRDADPARWRPACRSASHGFVDDLVIAAIALLRLVRAARGHPAL